MTAEPQSGQIRWEDVLQTVDSQVSTRLGDEVAILELDQGVYFGLNPTGARIWELLASPVAVKDIHARIVSEYEVDDETARRDVLDALEQLRAASLIKVCRDEKPG